MGMTISSSGRNLDDVYLSPKLVTFASSVVSRKNHPDAVSREKIIEMLKLENEYRLSSKWLELMEEESKNMEYPMKTIDLLQNEVAKASGYKTENEIENAIEFLRSAVALYPNDNEILESANYLKYNKMKAFPSWLYGSKYFDCQLYEEKLSDLLIENKGWNINLLNNIYFKYKHSVNFVSIYICEAHADDEWPIRTDKKFKINQHKTIEDRINVSKLLINEYGWKMPLYIDSIGDEFEKQYNGWPLRILLIKNDGMFIDYVASPIKPYGGVLQRELFDELEKTLESKINIVYMELVLSYFLRQSLLNVKELCEEKVFPKKIESMIISFI